jgi:hypothetical protein
MVGGVSTQSQDELIKKAATIPPGCSCGFEVRGQSENHRPADSNLASSDRGGRSSLPHTEGLAAQDAIGAGGGQLTSAVEGVVVGGVP